MRVAKPLMFLMIASGAVLLNSAASGAEAGRYECQVRKSVGVTAGSGAKFKLAAAPNSFELEIGEGPIFGDQLKESPLRRTDVYEPEAMPVIVARIHADLFSKPADRMISRDRRSFSDDDMSLIIADTGEFIAFGPVKVAENLGVAVYAGVCGSVTTN